MQVHFGAELIRAEWPSAVLCIGTFDGVHLGHQAVISEAVALAHQEERPCVLVTFDRHPAAILRPDRCPKSIASLDSNLREFEALGVSVAVILPFDKLLSQTRAQEFFDSVLVGKLKATALVVGHDFAFGQGREGTPQWLQARIETVVIPPVELDGARVSSSDVRSAVEAGNVERAARLLGRPFEIGGVVVAGRRLGRTLGFPTINLARSFEQITPADGIYSGVCATPGGTYRAAISIGMRPAVGGDARTIEAYLLDYPGDSLYGLSVRLSLQNRLRDELDFESLEALTSQMALDVEQTRKTVLIS